MVTSKRSLYLLGGALLSCLVAQAQEKIELYLKDGSRVVGALAAEGFRDGRYIVQVGDLTKEYPDADVVHVVLIRNDAVTPVNSHSTDPTILEIEDCLRQGDVTKALQLAKTLLEDRPGDSYAMKIYDEADYVAVKAQLEGATQAEKQKILEQYLTRTSRPEYSQWAQELLVNLSSAAVVSSPAIQAAMLEAQERLQSQDYAKALVITKNVLNLYPDHPEARRLYEEADYNDIKVQMERMAPREKREVLELYLTRASRPEFRQWCLDTLEAFRVSLEPSSAGGLSRYFPIRVGLWRRYRRSDSEQEETLRIEVVKKEDNIARIFYAREQSFRTQSKREVYQQEFDGGAIYGLYGTERIPLFRFNAEVGQSWSWKAPRRESRRTIRSTNEVVTVPKGTFQGCLLMEFSVRDTTRTIPQELVMREYYAPDIGLIRSEFVDASDRKYIVELTDYGDR